MRKSIDIVNNMVGAAGAGRLVGDKPDDIFEAIHAVMHLYRAQRHRGSGGGGAAAGAAPTLTHMEHRVLGFFARHPGATQSELAAHSGRDKGQLARLIGQLRERGLLEAHADEADRRNLRLQLTAEARSVHQAAQRQARRLAAAAVSGLSDAERATLAALLLRVRGNLEAAV